MIKVVLDCNVLISAGLTDGNCRKALIRIIENCENFICDEIIIEYRDVIKRPKFSRYYKYLFELFSVICENSIWIEKIESNYQLPDNDDKIYLDTALTSKSNYLITGNVKDYPSIVYESTKIITPKQFIDLF